MIDQERSRVGNAAWTVEDIPYDSVDPAMMRDQTELFHIIAAASFVEITSDLYTRNLIEYYRGDDEIADWLGNYWEREEVQHGLALKRYVQAAWPDFDWDRAYRGFFDEYSRVCLIDNLAETRALEMVARCVVETGTSVFYRTLSEAAPEPVLKQIAADISEDEVRHYKHFYHFFRNYRDREPLSKFAVLRQLWRRGAGVKAEDAYIAFKHVFLVAHPEASFSDEDYDRFRASFRRIGRDAFPYTMAVKMILKPLDLSPPIGRFAQPALEYTTRFLFSR
jgi:rubrerythrin